MKDLIKKILREDIKMNISPNAPYWVHDFQKMSKEERIGQIEKNKKDIEKLMPRIINFFKDKFGDDLVHLLIKKQKSYYGNESHSTDKIVLDFRFSEKTPNVTQLKREVYNDLNSFFNIDVTYYGTPLDLDFHKAVWQKF